jgi:hypothetical protein
MRPADIDQRKDIDMVTAELRTQAIEDVLLGTFPASDPPSWSPVMARPAPEAPPAAAPDDAGDAGAPVDGPRSAPTLPTVAEALTSLAAAAGVVLLFPIAVLVVGGPLALAVRGLLEVVRWVVGAFG